MIAIELQGRKALISGGDSGLGAATAKSLAQAGAALGPIAPTAPLQPGVRSWKSTCTGCCKIAWARRRENDGTGHQAP